MAVRLSIPPKMPIRRTEASLRLEQGILDTTSGIRRECLLQNVERTQNKSENAQLTC